MMGAGLSLDEAQEFMKDFIIRRGRLGVRLALLSLSANDTRSCPGTRMLHAKF